MKNLLIALLLTIFSLQATFVTLGHHVAATNQLEAAQTLAAMDVSDPLDLDADGLKLSNAIDELSDYLPANLSIAPAAFIAPLAPAPAPVLLSIVLPTNKPPPRA